MLFIPLEAEYSSACRGDECFCAANTGFNTPCELLTGFIDLKGFTYPILEIYGSTHMGNGSLHLYEVTDDRLLPIFETVAVDFYNESVWRPENYQNYGYGTCGQIYEGGKLSVKYPDVNKDETYCVKIKTAVCMI